MSDKGKGKGSKAASKDSGAHVMTNAATGETRVITQAEWRDNQKTFLAQGFARPAGIEDNDA